MEVSELYEPTSPPAPVPLFDFFVNHSPIFAQLAKTKQQMKERKDVDIYYQRRIDESKQQQPKEFLDKLFVTQSRILEEIDQKTNIIAGQKIRTFLDLRCCTGGYSHYLLRTKPSSKGVGIDLPTTQGHFVLSKYDKRYRITTIDFTQTSPMLKAQHDMAIINGIPTDERLPVFKGPESQGQDVEMKDADVTDEMKLQILLLSQLHIALDHLNIGGRMIVEISKKEETFYASVIQALRDSFEKVQLFKSTQNDEEEKSKCFVLCFGLHSKEILPDVAKSIAALKSGTDVHSLKWEPAELVAKYGNDLMALYAPLWELQQSALISKFEKVASPPPVTGAEPRTFVYTADQDTNGIVYFLTGGNPRNPDAGINITCSGIAVGEAVDFINREKVRCWTANQLYSWFCIDFGERRKVVPTNYTLGYGSPGTGCCPLYWVLQGSNKIRTDVQYGSSSSDTPMNDPDWKTLAIHNNDTTLYSEWAIHSWKLNCKQAFRFYRVVQTGPNSFTNSSGAEDNWSQTFVINRFELYGTLYDNQDDLIPPPALHSPMRYGSNTAHRAPSVIRADPQVMKELHEIIVYLAKHQHNENTKAEKVRVHEIILS